ncbi:MAG: hypothetical protein ACYCO9_10940 [Streptosporangiaceae bacterium]
MLAAVIRPDNTPGGYQLTYLFPLAVFIISAATLYLKFRRPHRVPGHVALSSSRWVAAASAKTGAPGKTAAPAQVERDAEAGE